MRDARRGYRKTFCQRRELAYGRVVAKRNKKEKREKKEPNAKKKKRRERVKSLFDSHPAPI